MATASKPDTESAVFEQDLLDTPAAGPAAIRGSVLRVAGYLLAMLLSVLSVSLLIRHLGVVDYGHYVTVISLVTLVQGITDIGLGQIGVREFATRSVEGRRQLMRHLLGVRASLTALGVALAVVFAVVAGYSSPLITGTLAAGVGMFLTVIQGTFAVPLASELRLGWVTLLDLLRQLLTVAAIVALVLAGAALLAFLMVTVPVALLVLFATWPLVRGKMPVLPSFDRNEWKSLLRTVLPFAAGVVIGTFYLRITIVLMSLLTSGRQTGYYATSYRVLDVLVAIPALTVGAALPVLARAARDDRERLTYILKRLFETTLITGCGLGLVVALGAPFAIQVLSGGKSQPSVVVLQIQSVAIVTMFLGATWNYGLLSLQRYRAILVLTSGALAVSLCLTLTLVPLLGAKGGAIAFSAAEVATAVGSLLFLRTTGLRLLVSRRVMLAVLAAVALGAAVILIPGLTSFARAVLAGAIYIVVLFLLRAMPSELLDAVLRRPQRT